MCGRVRARAWARGVAWAALVVALAGPAAARAANCTIGTLSGLGFGSYDPFAAAPLDSVATITYRCTRPSVYRITLGPGSSGTYTARLLRNGADVLRYNLFLDAGRTAVWGDGTGGTGVGPGVVVDAGAGSDTAYVFARVLPLQDVAVGLYSDTVQITFEF
jgi:spore coat protein U-like protein